jgi:alpha-L-glutamate ligase-like protein
VLIEYCVQFDPVFGRLAHGGVPDVRVIVYLGVPVMAMVRLPTRMSDGRANLHQGAIGTGVDMRLGETLNAVWMNAVITRHPDTRAEVSGVQIPGWDKILEIASSCHDLTGLAYQGVDIVLDRDLGPLILELNARPGLNIQIANKCGLQPRLDAVNRAIDSLHSVSERVAFAKEHFRAQDA